MKRLAEFALFVVLALGLHVAALGLFSKAGGAVTQGAHGEAEITLEAVPGDIQAVIDGWMATPEPAPQPLDMAAPVPEGRAPVLRPSMTEAPTAAAPLSDLSAPVLPAAPKVDTRTAIRLPAAKSKPAEPAAKPKPKTRPKAKPQRPQKKKAAAQPGQRASGTGKGKAAGNTGKAKAAGLSKGAQTRLIAEWGSKVRNRILRGKRYPRNTRGSGTVRLLIAVAPSGQLLSARIVRSSGMQSFDKAALDAVRRAGRFPRAPKGLSKSSYAFTLNMRFD
ncbi:TonB family protein [Aquicoccus sp. G2-2]|uniref:cell envelope integrity protein TolA n=1 Tax=Aquicoccus sp. G2-2 TaxID=3092120 RepID=UPI002AE01B7E|nr:TonB family protein [Aquicoccus sp. G2-2]MEA1114495.1 TonB family protein [Aquicoccus sp. G2-2]